MQAVTLFEYQEIELQKLGWNTNHPALKAIERINTVYGVNIIQLERNSIRAQQFVGILRLGDVTIQILPKIDYEGDSAYSISSKPYSVAVNSAASNLLALLSYTHDIDLYSKSKSDLRISSGEWFELLTRFLATELHIQIKQGLDQAYIRVSEQSSVLKGTWEIQKQIRRLPHERHLFDVTYDSFLPNTELNQIFLYAVSRLLPMSRDRRNRELLRDIQFWLQDVSLLPTISAIQLAAIQFTRLNARFRPAFNLVRLFLENMTPQLIIDERILFAFVFDMNILFERFVANFLQKYRKQILPPRLSNSLITLQGTNRGDHYLAEHKTSGRQAFRLHPDIMIFPNATSEKPIGIIDTKYKKLDVAKAKLGVSEADFYQMLAYATHYKCNNILLVYPENTKGNSVFEAYRIMPDSEFSIGVATINLRQPLYQLEDLLVSFKRVISNFLGGHFA